MNVKPIQCIVVSEDENYKVSLKRLLQECHPDMEVTLVITLTDALRFLNEAPPFKLLIRKPTISLSRSEIRNCMEVEERNFHLRIIVLQKEHKTLIETLNKNSIQFLKDEKNIFTSLDNKSVLEMLEQNFTKYENRC